MNQFGKAIEKISRRAFVAAAIFPITSLNAILFTFVTMLRIHLEWKQQEPYNLLFNSLHWAFGFGAIFGLTAMTFVRRKNNQAHPRLLANLITSISSLVVFLSLYFFGARIPGNNDYFKYPILSEMAQVRMTMFTLIVFLAFIILASRPKQAPKIARSVFMNQKALIIAGIYGLVLLAGTSAIASAIQVLLYSQMSFKVYQYLGSIVAFITFMLFLSNLPDFSMEEKDTKWQEAEQQSKFIKLLFADILTPIMIALTIVLLLWTIKTIFQGSGANFIRLSGIATSYTVVGLWLHMMVEEIDKTLTKFYLKMYPYAALVILAFEAWTLVTHLTVYGLQTTEYYFVAMWLVAVCSMVLILWKKEIAYLSILLLTIGAMFITVLPVVGFQALPIRLQTQRLEYLLNEAKMFKDETIVPSNENLERPLREKITLSAIFLANQTENLRPSWLKQDIVNPNVFQEVMGFAPIYPEVHDFSVDISSKQMFLQMESQAISIENYAWAIFLSGDYFKEGLVDTLQGQKGTYKIEWLTGTTNQSIPKLKITLNEQVILDMNMSDYLDKIMAKYPLGIGDVQKVPFADMNQTFNTEQITGMIVFRSVNVMLDVQSDTMMYWFEVGSIYLTEK